jgi:hypothetical protein
MPKFHKQIGIKAPLKEVYNYIKTPAQLHNRHSERSEESLTSNNETRYFVAVAPQYDRMAVMQESHIVSTEKTPEWMVIMMEVNDV